MTLPQTKPEQTGNTAPAADQLFADFRKVMRRDDNLQSNYTTWAVIKRIWREHLRPRIHLVAIAVVAMMVSAATTGAMPYIIQRVISDIMLAGNLALVYGLAAVILLITLLKTASEYVSNVTVQYLGHRFTADMRITMFERLVRADLSWIEDVHSGRFLSGFLTEATLLRQTASKAMLTFGENTLKIIVLLCYMAWLDWRLTTIIALCMPVGVYFLGRQRKKMRKSTKKTLQETGDLSAFISQTLRGIRVVRAYGQDENEVSRATNVINRALEFTMRGVRAKALANPIAEFFTGLGFALAVIYVGTIAVPTKETLDEFVGFLIAAMLMFQPLRSLATLQTSLQEGVAAASRVFGIIDREKELVELSGAKPIKVSSGEIELKNVSFAYDVQKPVLDNLSLKVPAGKTVALVGRSGSGKSTILNLVLRFFDPQQGVVAIDGQDISKHQIASLREAIALVTQDPVMFDDTIKANIAYGSPTASEEDIINAAKAAAAHDFIMSMPKAYDTSVREAGVALSGGERQRIAIARAILRDAPILLLDEPTSALDSESETKVQNALIKLMKDRTVLMIAHRLSTVQNADLICVLDQGRLLEMGTHADLLAKDGAYAKFCRSQFLAPKIENNEDE